MLKNLCLFCALVLAVSCSKTEEKPSYLYVITSKHGEIKQTSDGSWELILDHGNIEEVLAFSDRPYRIVKHITGEELKKLWPEGHNSFEKDPPNATVVINQHVHTVQLLSIHVGGSKTTYKLKSDGPKSLYQVDGATQVFIDGGGCHAGFFCDGVSIPMP